MKINCNTSNGMELTKNDTERFGPRKTGHMAGVIYKEQSILIGSAPGGMEAQKKSIEAIPVRCAGNGGQQSGF